MSNSDPNQDLAPPTAAKNNAALYAATIAACASVLTVMLTWFLTERIRTDIANQTLALEKVKVDIASQTLSLERVKVDLAVTAQQTANMTAQVNSSRLELERKIAQSTEYLGNRKVQIEDKRSNTDEIRLTPEFSRLQNELRPGISVECTGEAIDPSTHRITCSFANKGAHRASITPTGVSFLDRDSLSKLPEMILRFENGDSNTVLAGGTASSTYIIRLTPKGTEQKKPVFSFAFKAATDQVAINMAKKLAKGLLTDEDLAQLSVQTYVSNLWY